ncbi:hypothetical protein POPTR_010G122150v4 [Populus trichocarpa]|uniref:Uncharacterized protein n=1 Tax=Populus trichocarpa TaxID=3694 RepID=A0ACC0SD28_POPTR|nr:hypothetical protein POPTR_010G122150v4 [Populus trichocarpa]
MNSSGARPEFGALHLACITQVDCPLSEQEKLLGSVLSSQSAFKLPEEKKIEKFIGSCTRGCSRPPLVVCTS